MDLDELKYQLNFKLATSHAGKSDADIAVLLKKRTGSIINKLKRSLWFEICFCLLFMLLIGYICLVTSYWALRVYFATFSVLTLVFVIFLLFLLRRIEKLSGTTMPVKRNLQAILDILEEFVKRSFQFTMALIPVCFTFSFFLSREHPVRIQEIDQVTAKLFVTRTQEYLFLFIYLVTTVVVAYYFCKWYLKKLYGNYLKELKACICELER